MNEITYNVLGGSASTIYIGFKKACDSVGMEEHIG
jgi:hypothetical protein